MAFATSMAVPCRTPLSWSTPRNRHLFPASLHPFGSSSNGRLVVCRNLAAAEDFTRSQNADYDPWAGCSWYKPHSTTVMLKDAVDATIFALDAGINKLEIEFPPLPTDISDYKGSSDDFGDANIRLALSFANKLNAARGITSKILFEDGVEKRRAARLFQSTLDFCNGVSLGSLDDVPGGRMKSFLRALTSAFDLDFQEDISDKWNTETPPSMFIVVNCTARDLPDVRTYVDKLAGTAPVVLFNLELDKLRPDLGLVGFPAKDVQYDFLSHFVPTYYIRLRDYSKSVPYAPYVVNYSGALLRRYPGPWQVMLKQTNGVYACIAEDRQRFTLGQTRDELSRILGLEEEKGTQMERLRNGYKTSTWWEDDVGLEKSSAWRS